MESVAQGTVQGNQDSGGGDQDVWYVVIEGMPVGPLAAATVRARLRSGECPKVCWVWQLGMSDWVIRSSVPELCEPPAESAVDEPIVVEDAELIIEAVPEEEAIAPRRDPRKVTPPAVPAARSATPAAVPATAAAATTTATGAATPAAAATATAATATAKATATAAPATATPTTAARATPTVAAATPAAATLDPQHLTGARHEASLLFSLADLAAMAVAHAPSSSASRASGASGSSSMAADEMKSRASGSTAPGMSASREDRAMAPIGLLPSAVVSPLAQGAGVPSWAWGLVGGSVAAISAMALVAVLLLRHSAVAAPLPLRLPERAALAAPIALLPSPMVMAAPIAAAAAPASPAPSAAANAVPSAAAVPAPSAASTPAPSAAPTTDSASTVPAAHHSSSHSHHSSSRSVATGSRSHSTGHHHGANDDISDLLEAAPRPVAATEDRSALPDQPGHDEVQAGLRSVRPKVEACYAQYHQAGTALVHATIVGSGHVQSATVDGGALGSVTAQCVVRAVRSASFPKFRGASITVAMPYVLH